MTGISHHFPGFPLFPATVSKGTEMLPSEKKERAEDSSIFSPSLEELSPGGEFLPLARLWGRGGGGGGGR